VSDALAIVGCAFLFHDAWSMLLLLSCDCILLGNDAVMHSIRHVIATSEETHRRQIAMLEARIVTIHDRRRDVDREDEVAIREMEEESRDADREVETREAGHAHQMAMLDKSVFVLELFGAFVMAAHYIHIWFLHGASFGLVDAILLLHIQSTLSSVGRKVCR
jgi:hypothetical protein